MDVRMHVGIGNEMLSRFFLMNRSKRNLEWYISGSDFLCDDHFESRLLENAEL